MDTIHVWGIKFDPLTKEQIVDRIQNWIRLGRTGIHITGVNPEQVSKVQMDNFMKNAVNDSDLVNIDGILIVQTLRLYGYKIPERAATPDIFELLLIEANKKRQSVYFLGAEDYVLKNMIKRIADEYPNINIVGYHDGFYLSSEEDKIVKNISDLAPTFVFLGLPSPQKEAFIMKYKHSLHAGCCYGVGGAFDVKGGKVFRAPKWGRRLGLEWAFRIIQDPANYGKRVLEFYIPFIKLFFKEFSLNKHKYM